MREGNLGTPLTKRTLARFVPKPWLTAYVDQHDAAITEDHTVVGCNAEARPDACDADPPHPPVHFAKAIHITGLINLPQGKLEL